MKCRFLLHFCLGLSLLYGQALGANEQRGERATDKQPSDYPIKAVRILIAGPMGSEADRTARRFGQHLKSTFGNPGIVENRLAAMDAVSRTINAVPDGHTPLIVADASMANSQGLKRLGEGIYASANLSKESPDVVRSEFGIVSPRSESAELLAQSPSDPSAPTQQGPSQAQAESVDSCMANHVIGGAVIGGLVGLIFGGNRRDNRAVQGAIAGGIAGFLLAWSKCASQFTKVTSQTTTGYDDTAKIIGYSSAMGTVVKIEEFYVDPSALRPGSTVRLGGAYHVMAPANSDVQVVETRILKCQDSGSKQVTEVDRDTSTKTVAPGTRTISGELQIPSQAPSNPATVCQFDFEVALSDKKSQARKAFVITGNNEFLARREVQDGQDRQEREAAGTQRASMLASAAPQTVQSAPPPETPGVKTVEPTPTAAVQITATSAKPAEAPLRELLITVERSNVRKNPDAKAQVIGSVGKGERYPLFETVEISGRTWFQIRLDDGNKAWISSLAGKPAE